MPVNSQLGIKAETTWGTAVVVDRFYEYDTEGIQLETGRVEVPAMRSAGWAQRSDRSVPYVKGAAGPIEMTAVTKGMGIWFQHALGTITTSGAVDSCYTHTATVATQYGDGLSVQINRPLHPAGTDQAFQWAGGKISSFELAVEKEGAVTFTPEMVFRSEATGTALASASYSTAMEVFPWTGVALTYNAGTALKCENFTVSVDNGLDTERLKLKSSAARDEPTHNAFREITWGFTADFENLTHYNMFNTSVAGSNTATLTLTCTAPTLAGTATYPSLTVTLPAARFDEAPVNVSDMAGLTVAYSGKALFDGTSSPITITYVSVDSTA